VIKFDTRHTYIPWWNRWVLAQRWSSPLLHLGGDYCSRDSSVWQVGGWEECCAFGSAGVKIIAIVLHGEGYWSTGGSIFPDNNTAVRKRFQSPALKLFNLAGSAKSVQGCEGYFSFGSTRVKVVSQTSIYGVCILLVKKVN